MSVWVGSEINGGFNEAASKKLCCGENYWFFKIFSLKLLYASRTMCTFVFYGNVKQGLRWRELPSKMIECWFWWRAGMVNHLNWFLGSVILGMMDLPPAPASRGRNGIPLMIWLTHSYVLKAWLNYQFFQHSNAELQSTLCTWMGTLLGNKHNCGQGCFCRCSFSWNAMKLVKDFGSNHRWI